MAITRDQVIMNLKKINNEFFNDVVNNRSINSISFNESQISLRDKIAGLLKEKEIK